MTAERWRARVPALLDVAVGGVVGGAAVTARTAAVHQGIGVRAGAVASVAVAASLATWAGRRRAWPASLVLAVLAGSVLLTGVFGGRIVMAWSACSLPLAAWAVHGVAPPRAPEVDRRALGPVVGVAVLGGVVARDPNRWRVAFAISLAAWLVAAVTARRGEMVGRWVAGLRRVVTSVATFVPMAVLWLPFVALPWLLQRLVRFDPLGAPRRRPGTRWIPLRAEAERPERMWSPERVEGGPSFARRLHSRAPAALAAAIVLGVVVVTVVLPLAHPPPATEAERTLRSVEGFDELSASMEDVIEQSYVSHFVGVEWPDHSSRWINIEDGRRMTWTPPPPGRCEPTRVWMFGGSALFGVYQRDGHTIPSEVAREAHRRGMDLEVQNRGVAGDVAWQMNRRLERALAAAGPPDLVVYYDGWNDLRAIRDMDFTGRSLHGEPDFVGPLDRLHERVLSELGGIEPGRRYAVEVPETGPGLSADEVLDLATTQYATSHETAKAMARHHGFAFLHLHQPNLYTRSPRHPEEPDGDPAFGSLVRRFRAALPDEVVDLGGALDGFDEAAFYDEVHVTEPANRVIARSVVDEIAARLDLAGGPRCP